MDHHCNDQRFPGVYALAISPDGRTAASAEAGVVKLWSTETGNEVRRLTGHTNTVMSGALSPDGTLVATGDALGEVYLWKTSDAALVQRLTGKGRANYSAAWSHDGQTIAGGNTRVVGQPGPAGCFASALVEAGEAMRAHARIEPIGHYGIAKQRGSSYQRGKRHRQHQQVQPAGSLQ